ncbi:Radical SAM core domain-containing protein [Gammaproteobacteria bacterium]
MIALRKLLFRGVNWVSRHFFASRLSYAHIQAFLFNNSLFKLKNLLHVHWDIHRGREVTRTKPYILILETTNLCNLHCPFCLTGKGVSGGRETRHMGYDEAVRIIDDVADSVYLLQLYTWGEPLLNKDTLRVVEYAKQKNLYIMLSTNATAMTPAYNRRLIEAGIDYVTVAVDGLTQETYGRYRRGGNYEKVMANVRDLLSQRQSLKAQSPFVEWQFIVFRHNEHEVEEAEGMAYAIGIDKFTPLPAYVEDEVWSPQGAKYRTEIYNPERIMDCERPWSHLNIRADGGVASCCYEFFKKDDFGDLRTHRFAEVWNNELFQTSRRLIAQRRRGPTLEASPIICHDCLKNGVRPSYFDLAVAAPEPTEVHIDPSTIGRRQTSP